MSTSKVKTALSDFAKADKDRAIVLKGAWGTGKTYLWKQVVAESRNSFFKKDYSYVSLFGLNSLKDLKKTIYENKVSRDRAHIGSDEASLEVNHSDVLGRLAGLFRRSSSVFNDASAMGVRGIGPIVESLQFMRVTDTLICFDDFERKGSNLHDREVLGLISLLVESKNCRVIMLLNEETLKSNADFFSYQEKVFDHELNYNPCVTDSANLVFDSNDSFDKLLIKNAVDLNINNIRLLKKISYFAGLIRKPLENRSSQIIEQAFRVLPLAILAKYGSHDSGLDIKFLLEHNGSVSSSYSTLLDSEKSEQEHSNEKKSQFLNDYGFRSCDAFDSAVIDFVDNGYADDKSLGDLIKALEDKIKHDSDIALLSVAWKKFNKSFLCNEKEVFDAFAYAIDNSLLKFPLESLDSVASVYRDNDRFLELIPAIDKYFENFKNISGVLDKDDIFKWPSDSYIKDKLEDYFKDLVVDLPLPQLIENAYIGSGFHSEDVVIRVSQKKEYEFYDYLSSLNDENLTRYVEMCLKCGKISSSEQHMQNAYNLICVKTCRTLNRLAAMSLLNKSRMSKFKGYDKLQAHAEEELSLANVQVE